MTLHIKFCRKCLWVSLISIQIFSYSLSAAGPDLIEIAENVSIRQTESNEYLVTIANPVDSSSAQSYRLVSTADSQPPAESEQYSGVQSIQIPARRIVSLSTTYIGPLEAIGALDHLVAVDNGGYLYSEEMRKRIQQESITETGSAENLDLESIIAAKPDLVLLTRINPGQEAQETRIREAGIPVLVTAAWKETNPLGRSEWIKLYGILTGKEEAAFRLFTETQDRYEELTELIQTGSPTPAKVLLSAPFGGIWYMPGGQSYTSAFLRDSGAESLWNENPSTGSFPIDLESALARGFNADYWINPGRYASLGELAQADERFAILPVFRNGQVYNRTRRISASGGNDFWESGSVYPDRVLADLIAIFHPELLPDHKFYYYERLK